MCGHHVVARGGRTSDIQDPATDVQDLLFVAAPIAL
jgi:hypothetical protein